MLRWALAFFVMAIVAAMFGFAGVDATSAGLAKTFFYIFLIVFVVSLVVGLTASRRSTI